MDLDRFDRIARLLGSGRTRRAGLKAALGGLLGLGAATAALDADAQRPHQGQHADAGRRRRKRCRPACADGQTCVKGACACANGGTVCGANCCLPGETCEGGTCVELPIPGACVAHGEPCKNVGLPCCANLQCGSGQNGREVACWVRKTGRCTSTDECIYGTECTEGLCIAPVPVPDPPQVIEGLGTACVAARGDTCAVEGAECVPYDGPDAPGNEPGDYCTLPLNRVCSGDPDCTCYHCWYENPAVGGTSRAGQERTVSTRLACCGPAGYTCKTDRNCCIGALCVNGVCRSETTCDVCPAGGGCPYTSIKDAYEATSGGNPVYPAGSTITIAPATYDEGLVELDRDITFRRCGDSGTVLWRNAGTDGSALVKMKSVRDIGSVDFGFIDFTGVVRGTNNYLDFLWTLAGTNGTRLTVTALGCAFRDFVATSNGYSAVSLGSYTDADFTACSFTGIQMGQSANKSGAGINSYGIPAAPNQLSVTRSTFTGNGCGSGGAISIARTDLTAVDSTFTGNTVTYSGGAIYIEGVYGEPSSATLHDCQLAGNTAGEGARIGGGAIWAGFTSSLTLSGTTTVTGNTAGDYGSGIRVAVVDADPVTLAPGRITGTTSVNVTGNISAPDCQVWGFDSPRPKFAVSCDGWCVPSGGACQDGITTCCDSGQSCNSSVCS